MIRAASAILTACLLAAAPGGAADLALPYPAVPTSAEELPLSSHRVATGPWDDAVPFRVVEGAVTRRTWRLDAPGATPLQILDPLREQLLADGYEVAFACETRGCGGFDFRFGIDVTPAPAMFVNLTAYRYLAARRGDAWTTLLVSMSGDAGYVQETRIVPLGTAAAPTPGPVASGEPAPAIPTSEIGTALATLGHVVLSDLIFATGSSDLTAPDYPSLAALAGYMADNPSVTVALVGHTDAQGGAEGNLAISRRRADSARALLTGRYGVEAGRVESRGVGYFAPVAGNDTDAGREANRRVEAVVTSTD
ncbi:MAG: OmpA family protein [Jannaschia sp.]